MKSDVVVVFAKATHPEMRVRKDGVTQRYHVGREAERPATIDVDGVQRPTTNSDGRPIHATEEGIRNFWRWFGDSKVVDAQGRPLVMYHGTSMDKDFSRFKVGKRGAWFTSNKEVASEYAEQNDSQNYKYNPDTRRHEKTNHSGRVMPVYLKVGSPYALTIDDRSKVNVGNYAKAQRDLFSTISGHDGILWNNSLSKEWVILGGPEQIKSAIGNSGAFDPSNPNLTKSDPDYVRAVAKRHETEPSKAQIEAGNYLKPVRKWNGLTIRVENPACTVRRGRGWETKMLYDYGYIAGTEGVDGDEVDVYVGPDDNAPTVYVIHQRKHGDWDKFDEDKCMLGFASEAEAKAAYLKHYDDPRFLGQVTAMPVAEFIEKARATAEKPRMIKAKEPRVLLRKAHISVEVSPAGRAHGETEGQWFNALVWLAEKTGAKAPANAARLHKQDTGRRRVSDGDMTKSTQSLILFLKAHVRAYTRRDGTMVEAHEDKRPAARAKAKEDNRTADMFASQQKPAREYPRGATEEQGDMFGGGDTPSHKPHEQLSAALKRGDLSGAMAVLSPLDKTGVEDALLHSGFEVSGSSKAEVISRAQQKLVEAAKRKTDGHGLRDGSDTITMPRAEAIKEHERLVGVLNSPSHADDKAEAKKQAAELAEMKQEVGEHDHLLSDIPGAKWKRGKGLIAGHYGVEVDGDVLGNYHAKPEDAAAEAKGVLAVRVASAEQKARTSAAMAALRERIEGGGDVTDADLNLLGLRPRSSGLDWFIPAAASLFGISSRAVRPHIKDLIRIGHTDMGVKKEFVDPKKALRAIAGARKPASPHPTETPEFKRWFGDSKVVGADGEPRIVLPKGKKSENNSFHRVRISSPFGKFDVYVDHHKDATPDDYKRDAKTAFLNDSGAGSGFASSSQIKVMGEPEQVSSHPSSATRAKGADWAKIVRAEDSLDHHIKLAADSIEKLRKPDVYRVLESAGKDREKLAAHISDKRPDLADEVREIMTDEFS